MAEEWNILATGGTTKEGIVGVAVVGEKAWLWRRSSAAEEVQLESEDFAPYLWLHGGAVGNLLQAAGGHAYQVSPLEGAGFYDTLVRAGSMELLERFSKDLAKETAISSGSPNSPQLYLNDGPCLCMMERGYAYYQGLALNGVRRLSLALATQSGQWSDLGHFGDQPLESLYWGPSHGEAKVWRAEEYGGEKGLLQALQEAILAYDPDIIEGHGLYDDLLPYLVARAQRWGLKLNWGRPLPPTYKVPKKAQRLELKGRKTYTQIAGKRFDYLAWEIWGRELVDTLSLARLRDVTSRELETFTLPEVATWLELVPEGEEGEWEGARALSYWGPIVGRVVEILLYPFFVQAKYFPLSLQNTILRGSATKINYLLLESYLHLRAAVPARPQSSEYMGALASMERQGFIRGVAHCDVQSLYPSIMLSYALGPQSDGRGVFLELLRRLYDLRWQAKEALQRERSQVPVDAQKVHFYDVLQGTFKILINSFYGYLGFAQGNFADFERAAQVTARGREILELLLKLIRQAGGEIVEYDTDGVYFSGCPQLEREEERRALAERLNSSLPPGIKVAVDAYYLAMYSQSTKNYALLKEGGEVSFSGATFRARSRELYLRQLLQRVVSWLLRGDEGRAREEVARVRSELSRHRLPIAALAKTEVLNDSPENYQKKIAQNSRHRSAAYEIALRAPRPYRSGQAVSYYITGTKKSVRAFDNAKALEEYDPQNPDENQAYYAAKLETFLEKVLGSELAKRLQG